MTMKPIGWSTAKIGDLCVLKNGRAFKPTEWSENGVPIVRIQNLNNPVAPYNHYEGEIGKNYSLEGGELLFAWSGTPGTSFGAHVWHGGKAVLNQHIFRVDFDENFFDKRFFRYAINQTLEGLIDIAHGGVGLRHVTKGKFEATEIAVPPLLEQRRIADKLDSTISRIKSCRNRLNRVQLLIKRFRQSVLSAGVSGRLTDDWRRTLACSNCNEATESAASIADGVFAKCNEDYSAAPDNCSDDVSNAAGWENITVGDIALDLRYGTSKKCHYQEGGTAVLRIPNIGQSGKLDISDLKFSEFDTNELSKLRVESGDLLIIRSNGSVDLVGKCSVAGSDAAGKVFAGYLLRLRVDSSKVLPWFVYYCLAEPEQRYRIERISKSTSGVNNINAEELRSLPIRLPSLMEQHEIVRRIEKLLAFADRIEGRLTSATLTIQELKPAVLAKAFRGELALQDPNDEPARKLLERLATSRSIELGSMRRRDVGTVSSGAHVGA